MKKLIIMTVCLLGSLGISAQTAQTAQTAESREYEEVLKTVVGSQVSEATMAKMYADNFESLVKQGILSQKNCDALSAELSQYIYPRLLPIIDKQYRENFTLSELKEIAKWVTSPIGKKLTDIAINNSKIITEFVTSPEILKELQNIIAKYVKF